MGSSPLKTSSVKQKYRDSIRIWRRQWHPTPVLLLENPMDGRAWWAAVHGVAQGRTQLSDFTFTFHFHAWEKEMATYSRTLPWKSRGGVWLTTVHGITKSRRRLSDFFLFSYLVIMRLFSISVACLCFANKSICVVF